MLNAKENSLDFPAEVWKNAMFLVFCEYLLFSMTLLWQDVRDCILQTPWLFTGIYTEIYSQFYKRWYINRVMCKYLDITLDKWPYQEFSIIIRYDHSINIKHMLYD